MYTDSLRLELAGKACFIKPIEPQQEQVTASQEANYIRVPFRAISKTIVGAYSYKATDFRTEGVLQEAVTYLVGKPAFINHEVDDVTKIVGIVESAKWSEANENIPAGIDIVFKIDTNSHALLAKALTSNPPEIQSCSVTIDFEWTPSHTQEYTNQDGNFDYWAFFADIGTIAKDGRMVCRVAQKINEIYECSLVGFGADPYAKILVDGKPFNPDRGTIYNFIKEKKNLPVMLFVRETGEIDEGVFHTALQEAYTRLRKALAQVELAQTLTEQLRQKAVKYDLLISEKRQEAVKLYKLQAKEKPNPVMLAMLQKASDEELNAFLQEFGGSLTNSLQGYCKVCNSKEVAFRSSEQNEISKDVEQTEFYKPGSMKL